MNAGASGHHDATAVIGYRGFIVGIGGGGQPSDSPSHAETDDADMVVVHCRMTQQKVHGGVAVGNDFRVAEGCAPLVRIGEVGISDSVEQFGSDGAITLGRQFIALVLNELINAADGLSKDHCREGAGAAGNADVGRHLLTVYLKGFP